MKLRNIICLAVIAMPLCAIAAEIQIGDPEANLQKSWIGPIAGLGDCAEFIVTERSYGKITLGYRKKECSK